MSDYGISIGDTWEKWQCPHCKVVNWVCLGNMDDETLPDYESCKCFSCNRLFWLGEMDKIYNDCFREGGLENSYYQDGKDSPGK